MRHFLFPLIFVLFLSMVPTSQALWKSSSVVVPNDYPSIEKAYANVKDGGIITIKPGKYLLSKTLVVNRDVTFRGDTDNPEAVVIDCSTSNTFQITGGSPSFQNLTINNNSDAAKGKDKGCCFFINGGTPKLFRCIMTSRNGGGIVIDGKDVNPLVEKCILKDNACGIAVRQSRGEFRDCDICENEMGIVVADSGNPTLIGCKIHDTKDKGRHVLNNDNGVGVMVVQEGRGEFSQCDIYGNELVGIAVAGWGSPTVTGSKIHNENIGVSVMKKGLGVFQDCEIYGNKISGIAVSESGDPTVEGCKIHDEKNSGVIIFDKGMGTFNNNKLSNNNVNWLLKDDAGEVKGSSNTPEIPQRESPKPKKGFWESLFGG